MDSMEVEGELSRRREPAGHPALGTTEKRADNGKAVWTWPSEGPWLCWSRHCIAVIRGTGTKCQMWWYTSGAPALLQWGVRWRWENCWELSGSLAESAQLNSRDSAPVRLKREPTSKTYPLIFTHTHHHIRTPQHTIKKEYAIIKPLILRNIQN